VTNGFFEHTAHQLIGDRYPFPITEVVSQQMEGPALLPCWRHTASQGSQPRLVLPIELAVPILPFGPVPQGSLNPFRGCSLAQPLNRGTAHLNRFGDLGISPLRPFWAGVSLQEDAGACDDPGTGRPLLDRGLQEQTLGIRERDNVQLGHGKALQ
jgi:hypothetical protein